MKRIGFSGLPGVGKTSIARAVSAKLSSKYSVELISEYARSYINEHQYPKHLWEQIIIFEKQLEWETKISDKTDIMITDSPIFLGFVYSLQFERISMKDDMLLNNLFAKMLSINRPIRYDLIIHIKDSKDEITKDGIRPELHHENLWRQETESLMINVLKQMFRPKLLKITSNVNFDEKISESIDFIKEIEC